MSMSLPIVSLSYLDSLNPAQRAAAETVEGPLLVLAGAGTGKTKTLTARLAFLLATGHAYPSEILAVTFTNKAAAEMKRRVSALLEGRPVEGWWLGTFHSLCARMLRRHAEIVGLKQNFTILDEDDQIRLLKQLMEANNIDVKKWPARMALSVIQGWKDLGREPSSVSAHEAAGIAEGKLPRLYREYQDRLRILNACDFGDLLLHVLTIFRDPAQAQILESYRQRFKYILVDEYQDTNAAQYQWLRLLAEPRQNICCVGDDDQSIYGWRGADVGNILRFEKDFPGAQIVRLEQNYRSTQHILSAANGVIAHNKSRLGKELWSADQEGERVILRAVWDGMQEAIYVAGEIERLQRQGFFLNEMAVLVRASHQTRLFEEVFMRHAIPHKVLAGMRFYERQEIRDAIAYLRVIAQSDDDLAFERIINVPKRGIGAATVQKIHIAARSRQTSLYNALLLLLETDELTGKTKETLQSLMRNFERWRMMSREIAHAELTGIVLDESGYTGMWLADKSPEAAGRLENLKEFVGALREFESLDAFLEHVSLVMDTDAASDGDQVTIMTYHAAKGLEYDAVFLPGWEEGLFPNQRAMDESGVAGLEEERRLAYVGLTRARKRAFICFAANRLVYGGWTSSLPSRFIEELPAAHVDMQLETFGGGGIQQPAYGGGYRGRAARLAVEEETVSFAATSEGGFAMGERVLHQKFGNGTVVAVEGNKLEINFDKAGRKKVVDSFVTRAG